jgi:hypothetical protein
VQLLPVLGAEKVGHVCPHVPQLLLSVCVLMQLPLQFCSPLGHPHTPLLHVTPLGDVHAPHAAPPVPHMLVDWLAYASHVAPLQQPLMHDAGPQVFWQIPPLHCCVAEQLVVPTE